MSYDVRLGRGVAKQLAGLPRQYRVRIVERLERLAEWPDHGQDVSPLRGEFRGLFRLRIGPSKIRSTRWLSVHGSPEGLVLEGAGWGHGVGLCQMGAIGRAQQGQKGEEIVLAYYAGAKLKTAY